MVRKRRRHEDDEALEVPPGTPARRAAERAAEPAATILDLQARAGNTAVTSLLAGDGPAELRGAIQREAPSDESPAEEERSERSARASALLSIPELRLSVPVLGVSFREAPEAGREKVTARDIDLTIADADYDQRLNEAMLKGTQFDSASISFGGTWRWILRQVLVASISFGGGRFRVSLNFTSITHT